MFIGAIPYGLAFILLLSPLPSLDAAGLATWFGAFYIIFFLFNTFTNIPYDALAPELTDNEGDRQKLFFVCTMFDGLVRLRTLCIFSLSGYISLSPPPSSSSSSTSLSHTCLFWFDVMCCWASMYRQLPHFHMLPNPDSEL
jgi:Na+/melibiose symporter-like transporter